MKKNILLKTALFAIFVVMGYNSFAVSQDKAEVFIVKESEDSAYLGIYMQDLTTELRNDLGIQERHGAVVLEVIEDSPAAAVGLEKDDVIVMVNDERIANSDDLREIIANKNPGEILELEIIRDGEHVTMSATLAEQPKDFGRTLQVIGPDSKKVIEVFGKTGVKMGVQLQDLNSSLAEYFETEEGKGVLVTDVEKGSPAETAQLKAGDVLLTIDGKEIGSVDDIYEVLEDKEKGEIVAVEYLRKGEKGKTDVELEESKGAHLFSGDFPHIFHWQGAPDFRYHIDLPDKEDIQIYLKDDLDKIRDRIGDIQVWSSDDIEKLKDEIRELKKEIEELKKKIK